MDCSFHFVRRDTSRFVVGDGVEAQLPTLLRELGNDAVVVLHDPAVAPIAERIAAAVGARTTLPIAGGETSKQLANVGSIATELRKLGATRRTALLALGGGTITDLVSFVAATFLRGVPFVACPTTTLALCDAALGGKNGVDHGGLKNELGTIRQPQLLVGDVAWLRTLPDALFREGFVEVVKKAAVLDAPHFARLEQLAPAIARRDAAATREAIEMAVAMKMAVVVADEHEGDRRRWLNFGHTIGHALESLADGALRHGECVALGMLAECRAAGVPAATTQRIAALLRELGAPTTFPPQFTAVDALWQRAQQDKKVRDGRVPMVVPTTLGAGTVENLTRETLARSLA